MDTILIGKQRNNKLDRWKKGKDWKILIMLRMNQRYSIYGNNKSDAEN